MTIRFEWDELKNQRNKTIRGLDFVSAVEVLREAVLFEADRRKNYGEERLVATGVFEGRLVVVVYTRRSSGVIRIISFRKANSRERKIYEKKIADRLGTS